VTRPNQTLSNEKTQGGSRGRKTNNWVILKREGRKEGRRERERERERERFRARRSNDIEIRTCMGVKKIS